MLHTKNTAHPTEIALQLFRQPIPTTASPTSITRPQSTLNFAIPHDASLSTHALASVHPQKTHLLGQKKSMSVTESYLLPCPLNWQLHRITYFTSWRDLSSAPYIFFSPNISAMTSVTEVTRVRSCKVQFAS